MGENKKSVSDIIIERIIKDVDETGEIFWQRPYQSYSAFNWYTKRPYMGINRILLPYDEYLTYNQFKEFAKTNKGKNYKWVEGSKWFYVVFYKDYDKQVYRKAFEDLDLGISYDSFVAEDGNKRKVKGVIIFSKNGKAYRKSFMLRYTRVTSRTSFVDEEGKPLPSRVENDEVEIVRYDAKAIIDDYIDRENLNVNYEWADTPCYIESLDTVCLNKHTVNEEAWFSTAFHELSHSTGSKNRLDRQSMRDYTKSKEIRAIEECVAEISASMLCAECNIHNFETSESFAYKNNIAYVKSWKKRIQDWGGEFINIVKQAEIASLMILDRLGEDTEEKIEN